MKTRDSHHRLLRLLCMVMLASAGLLLLAGSGGVLPFEQAARGPSESGNAVADSFDRIVPGMTRADDLPGLGFDTAKADMLSRPDLARRFPRGARRDGVRDCIQAGIYCTALAFHAVPAADPFGLRRIVHDAPKPADIVLLVMNGRVIHKVFSSPARGVALARAF